MAIGDHIEDTPVQDLPAPKRPVGGQVPQELYTKLQGSLELDHNC